MADTVYGMEDVDGGSYQSPKRPITEEGTPDSQGQTIHIPREFLQGTQFKAGDELILKVVTSDEEGLEVAYAKAPEKEKPSEGEGGGDANKEIDAMDSSEY